PAETASFTPTNEVAVLTATATIVITTQPPGPPRIYPNPTRDKFKYMYTLSEDADTEITIYTVAYRLIARFEQRQSAGVNIMEINVQNLANGTYFIVYKQKGQTTNTKRIDK